jgi:Nas2 N_terminal domain
MSTPLIDSSGFPRADIDVAQSIHLQCVVLMASSSCACASHSS